MALHKPQRSPNIRPPLDLNQQGANALLGATFDFLRRNRIPKKAILQFIENHLVRNQRKRSLRVYRELEQAQEDMGVIIGTWFSHPKFLDTSGNPIPIVTGKGANSLANLVRASGTGVTVTLALELMRRSRSVQTRSDGRLIALRRAFVLPKLEVLRAAFVIERYLDTLQQIALGGKQETPLILERSCHVSSVDLAKIIPILRDIESRGTAFMDSIDGDLECRRLRRPNRKKIGELGVHVFVWTKSARGPSKKRNKLVTARVLQKQL